MTTQMTTLVGIPDLRTCGIYDLRGFDLFVFGVGIVTIATLGVAAIFLFLWWTLRVIYWTSMGRKKAKENQELVRSLTRQCEELREKVRLATSIATSASTKEEVDPPAN